MDRPIFYLILRQLWNRNRSRLSRLRRPRVLVAALIIGAYLIFSVLVMSKGGGASDRFPSPGLSEIAAPLGLMLLFLMAWIPLGKQRLHPLGFQKTEVELLFPLPVSRRLLVAYRLLAAQPGLIVVSLIVPFFLMRRLRISPLEFAAFWTFVNCWYLNSIAAAFARETKREAGLGRVLFPWLPGIALVSWIVFGLAMAEIDVRLLFGSEFMTEVKEICTGGAFSVTLAPFRTIAGLVLGEVGSTGSFAAFGWTLLLLAGLVGWIFLQESRFEEAALRSAELRAARLEAWKKGQWAFWRGPGARGPVKAQPFHLAPTGSVLWAYLWDGLLGTSRRLNYHNLLIGIVLCAALGAALGVGADRLGLDARGRMAVGLGVGGNLAFMIYVIRVLGRRRLEIGVVETLEVLKPLPIPGRVVFLGKLLGEFVSTMALYLLLWSAVVPFAADGLILASPLGLPIVALSFAALGVFVTLGYGTAMVLALWLPFTAAFRAAPVDLLHNTTALLFRFFGLLVLLLPPGIGAVIVALLFRGLPAAPIACLGIAMGIMIIEVMILVPLGGSLYDRFDVTVER